MATVRSGDRAAAWRATAPPADEFLPDVTETVLPGPRAPGHQSAGWSALGCQVSLLAIDEDRLADAASRARILLERLDRVCHRARPDSDLRRANQGAGQWVRVDPLLAGVVLSAARVAAATSGLVEPGTARELPALRHASHTPEPGQFPGAPAPLADSWKQLEVDPGGGLKIPPGTQLSLGGTAMAFAADLVARQVSAAAGTSLVVCIGGDVAVGSLPGEHHRWRIDVSEHPEDPRRGLAVTVVLAEGALATSSTLARQAQPPGALTHHQRDPRTGLPVTTTWRTASVCAATCVDASAASAAALVLGDQAPAWLWQRSLAARLVTPTGRVLRIAGWPQD
jgi:thiamine biosynthesis lipoprotein